MPNLTSSQRPWQIARLDTSTVIIIPRIEAIADNVMWHVALPINIHFPRSVATNSVSSRLSAAARLPFFTVFHLHRLDQNSWELGLKFTLTLRHSQ
jgi:hypothetical protein